MAAKLITMFWRDIPAQVIAKRGRQTAKIMLSTRFQEAVDRAAMRAGKGGSDAYMSEWRREQAECSDDLQAEADAAVQRLEEAYTDADLTALTRNKGTHVDAG